ncbi:MAG: two-component sensor histidine kinase [Magnetospirillum sp.]|nr:two-component sensor histidine kinase [Magnetospirillum sp.]
MMMMMLRKKGRENKIGRRMIVLIVAFSSFLALLATAYQLSGDYRQQRADMDVLLEDVEIFLPPIISSVWSFDEAQIGLALNSLTRLPHVERATITTSDGRSTWSSGDVASKRQITREYALNREIRGEIRRIATLEVTASLDGIYGRLLTQAITILISNAVKTFLVAAFMYVIFSRLVTRRVEELARNVSTLVPESLLSQASLYDEKLGFPENGDEIDRLRWAYDNIARQLNLAVQDLHDRHTELEHEVFERKRAEADLQKGMSNLIRDLLEYSRAGGHDLALAPLDCAPLVESVVSSLRPVIEDKQAELRISPLPRLVADEAQLHQVFHNLISNALKYSTANTIPVVEVKAERLDKEWRFEIADNGIGIDPQYHDYVFEVFRRLHSGNAYPGTGIGLAICKRIIESHGGHLWLRSSVGQGSSFFFTLPDADPAQQSLAAD